MKIQLIKLLVFAALLTGFYAFDGFERPVVSREDYRSPGRVTQAWIITIIIFVGGAILALWGNAIAETLSSDSPYGLYPTLGVILIIAGFVWMLMIRDSVRM